MEKYVYKLWLNGDDPEYMEIIAVGSLLAYLEGIESLEYAEKIKSGEIKTEDDALEQLENDGHYIEKVLVFERSVK